MVPMTQIPEGKTRIKGQTDQSRVSGSEQGVFTTLEHQRLQESLLKGWAVQCTKCLLTVHGHAYKILTHCLPPETGRGP
jgi:hypothetical protein